MHSYKLFTKHIRLYEGHVFVVQVLFLQWNLDKFDCLQDSKETSTKSKKHLR